MTTMPATVVLRLREAVYSELIGAAEDIASLGTSPYRERDAEWAEPVARFDRARALLDAIGWNERDLERDVQIDLDEHRRAIVTAFSAQLEIEEYFEAEKTPRAAEQRERARRHRVRIEAFMTATGLERE